MYFEFAHNVTFMTSYDSKVLLFIRHSRVNQLIYFYTGTGSKEMLIVTSSCTISILNKICEVKRFSYEFPILFLIEIVLKITIIFVIYAARREEGD